MLNFSESPRVAEIYIGNEGRGHSGTAQDGPVQISIAQAGTA